MRYFFTYKFKFLWLVICITFTLRFRKKKKTFTPSNTVLDTTSFVLFLRFHAEVVSCIELKYPSYRSNQWGSIVPLEISSMEFHVYPVLTVKFLWLWICLGFQTLYKSVTGFTSLERSCWSLLYINTRSATKVFQNLYERVLESQSIHSGKI